MSKKFKLRFPDEDIEIELEPIRREEVPKRTKEDIELMILWSMRCFPFIEGNHDVIFSKTRQKRLKRAFHL